MNFIPALPNWGLALLAAVPLGIILLYFLKLRRQPLTVPSTFLWERAIEDLHVNSLLQRLRNNLLLFLQLLFMILAILAILRPGWQSEDTEGRRVIYLLDSSASMGATDLEEGRSRFDQAKLEIEQQLDALNSNDEAMLIAFSDRADILQEFTTDHRRVKDALSAAKVTNRTTNVLEALNAASGLANPNRTSQAADVNDIQVADAAPADLHIFSDGRFGNVTDFSLGNLTPTYHRVGSTSVNNLAITAFSAERNLERPDEAEAFAQITNYGDFPVDAVASLSIAGELVEAVSVSIAPGEQAGLPFELTVPDETTLQLRLEGASGKPLEDDLALDNTAFAALAPPRNVSVLLVTPGNKAVEIALSTEQASSLGTIDVRAPDYLKTEEYQRRATASRDDLIIFDRCAPAQSPPANTFYIGSLPPGDWKAGELTGPILPIDIDRTHPIMRYLELFSLKIVEGRSLEPPRGTDTLISADVGPVLCIAPREGFQDLVMGFDVISLTEEGGNAFNTDWPVQRSWPVFIYNVMRYLGGAVDTATAISARPGETVPLRVDNRLREVAITLPQGDTERMTVGPAGLVPFVNTDATGIYRVTDATDDATLSLFTVNLFDTRESAILPEEAVEIGYERIESTAVSTPQRSEAWRWLLLIGLLVLSAEWIIFNRRLI